MSGIARLVRTLGNDGPALIASGIRATQVTAAEPRKAAISDISQPSSVKNTHASKTASLK